MILTINDFDGYNKDCPTIKKIKSWIEDKGGSFDIKEMLSVFGKEHYSFKSEVIRYINAQHLNQYLQEFILEEEPFQFWHKIFELKKDIEEKSKRFGSILQANELIKKEEELLKLNQELKNGHNYKDGTVLQVLNYFFTQSFQPQPYLTTNHVMQSVLYNLCTVAKFEEDDFSELMKKFNFGYWGSNSIESFYGTMIVSGNNSAWKSFEKALERTPFIIKSRRMYEGITFRVAEDNKWISYRCTGWNDVKKIKFLIDKEEKQKRFAFDNKEFKAFFKDKKIEF